MNKVSGIKLVLVCGAAMAASLLVFGFRGVARQTEVEKAKIAADKTKSLSNLKQISIGMLMYCGDWDDNFPSAQSTAGAYEVTYPYVKNKESFNSLNPLKSSFYFSQAVSGVSAAAIALPAETPLYYESKAWPDGDRLVSYSEGHAKIVHPGGWAKVDKALKVKISKSAKPLPAKLGIGKWKIN